MLIIFYVLDLRENSGFLINIDNVLKFMIDGKSTMLLRLIYLFIQQLFSPCMGHILSYKLGMRW